MASSTILREFLVSLGFRVDEPAMKKFTHGIATATKAVFTLGAVVEATAIGVAVGVARFAANLEQLYFAAQRTGSSADQLKAFDLAARNFGASMDEAQASVEGLAAYMRYNPGGQNVVAGWLGTVGLSAKGANGQMLTGVALMAQVGRMFEIMRSRNQAFMAHNLAGQWGISDKTMLAMSTPGFAEELARQEKYRKGWEGIAKAAHAFMDRWEGFKLSFAQMTFPFLGVAMGALERLMGAFGRFLQHHGDQAVRDLADAFKFLIDALGKLLDWLDQNGSLIQKRIDESLGEIGKVYQVIRPALLWLRDEFVHLDQVTGGWSTKLLLAAGALKALGATGIITGLVGIAAAMTKGLVGALTGAAAAGEWTLAGTAFATAAALAIAAAVAAVIWHYLPDPAKNKVKEDVSDAGNWWDKEVKKFQDWSTWKESLTPIKKFSEYSGGDVTMRLEFHTTVNAQGQHERTAQHVASIYEQRIRDAATRVSQGYEQVTREASTVPR